jgi:hypothetical protein
MKKTNKEWLRATKPFYNYMYKVKNVHFLKKGGESGAAT